MLKLSNQTAQLLSSGQVITCACNVVKELVENALDAGADVIDVKLEKGGMVKIEVKDNGAGIKACEVDVVARRHYTSKITSHLDLQTLSTYGFRGEALSSVCEIADVVITTRTKLEPYSCVYSLNSDGTVKSKKPSHISQGTTVTVINLFKNLPVRKQFYGSSKKIKEQIKLIEVLLMSFAISKPNVQYKLTSDRCIIWQKSRSDDEKSSFLQILSASEAQFLTLSTDYVRGGLNSDIQIQICFPKKYLHRKSLDRFFLIINTRPIRNKLIEKMVRSFILKLSGENDHTTGWPTVCVVIKLPSSMVDVNVNPNKTAVHFSCLEAITDLLQKMFEPLLSNQTHSQKALPHSREDMALVDEQLHSGLSNTIHEKQMFDANYVSEQRSPTTSNRNEPESEMQNDDHTCSKKNQSNTVVVNESLEKPSESDIMISNSENALQMPDAINENLSKNLNLDSNNANNKSDDKENCAGRNGKTKGINGNEIENDFSGSRSDLNNGCEIGSRDWSCGDAIRTENGEVIAPVKIIRPLASSVTCNKRPLNVSELRQSTLDNLTVPVNAKRPRSVFEVSKDTIDKNLVDLSDTEQAEIIDIACKEYDDFSRKTAKQNKARKSFITLPRKSNNENEHGDTDEVPVSLDFAKLSQRVEKLNLESKCKDTVRPIGYLSNYNAAVIKNSSQFILVNLIRLQENLVFQNLSQSFKVPYCERDTFFEINEANIGAEALNCLRKLSFSQVNPENEILDERILSNGFKIKRLFDSPQKYLISDLATVIPCYGVSDLKEILLKICRNSDLSLDKSRPAKCIYYLQSEAARIAQSSPALRNKNELLNAIHLTKKCDLWVDNFAELTCFHKRNIFLPLQLR